MRDIRIPFNRSSLVGRESEYIAEAMGIGQIAGNGSFGHKCQHLLAQLMGVEHVLLTASCTQALEMSALLLDIQPGDEVIVPSFTFVSTASAFVLRGARPLFADIRPDTLNLDEEAVAVMVTPRTRVIVPVHYAGVGCEMDAILGVAARHGIAVVEDNAHGLLGRYRGRFLGSFGALATQSFHETKNFTSGEGGALVINDGHYAERAEIIREKGTNRAAFARGQVDRYTWTDVGSSYLMSDVLAAFLYGQLQAHELIQQRRQQIWRAYDDGLRCWAADNGVRTPVVPPYCQQTYHMYYLVLPTAAARGRLIEQLGQRGILAVFHYQPLNTSPMGRRLGGRVGQCPVAETTSERLVRLPFYVTLSADELEEVVSAVCEVTL